MHKHMKKVNGSQKIQNLGLFTKMNFKTTLDEFSSKNAQNSNHFSKKKKLHFLLHFLQRTMAAGGKEEGMRLHS